MSIHLQHTVPIADGDPIDDDGDSGSSDEDDEEETWDDWVSDSASHKVYRSLFDDKVLPGIEAILAYDKAAHNFDLNEACAKLSLDVHGRIRLINFIRRTKPPPENIALLTGKESFFSSDDFLHPALEDDPFLQYQPDDWTDSEDEASLAPERRIQMLERKLKDAQREFDAYRKIVTQRFSLAEISDSAEQSTAPKRKRDDDSHYFESYGANDIHAVMIQDKVRTSTYARYILGTPSVFEDAVVLDVGCGTGILSMFAARAGARRVFAVDASDIAIKAEKMVKANKLDNIISVIRGKIEDIQLPEDVKVDVIISEWMGYALLYESMLDSVLIARDRFLKDSGVMAPTQSRIMLGLSDASEIVKERLSFWNDIYGFDMSVMAEELYDEAIIDVVGPRTMLSSPYSVKDLNLSTITPRQLDFISPFKLTSTVDRRTKVSAFILYFDIFFTASGNPVPPETEVAITGEDEAVFAEVWPLGGRPPPQRRASQRRRKEKSTDELASQNLQKPAEGKDGKQTVKTDTVTSFSTSPKSIPTHWKQTLFLLKEPFVIDEGTIVQGHFHCPTNYTSTLCQCCWYSNLGAEGTQSGMSAHKLNPDPGSRHMSTQPGSSSEPRPALERSDTENLLSYYQSPLADKPYQNKRQPASLSRQLSTGSTSESDYSASSHSDYSTPSTSKRSTLPSEGGSDRRRVAIVEMDTMVRTAKRHGKRKQEFGSLALVAPPDASPKSYTQLTPPLSTKDYPATSKADLPGGDESKVHHRSQSEVTSPRKSPRDVGIVGTARQPIVLDLETVNENSLQPPIFIHPQSRSPGPSSPAASLSGPSLLPPLKRRSTGQSIVIRTPEIGTGKAIDAPVAGPVVVDVGDGIMQTSSPENSPSLSQTAPHTSLSEKIIPHVPSSYLDYKPGVHATAGPLPPPPRTAITLDTHSPAPPRPPRFNSPAPQQISHASFSNSHSTKTSRQGDIDSMRQALQLPPSVAKVLAARPLTLSKPPTTKTDVPMSVSENPSLTSLTSSLSNHGPLEATKSIHRREGAFSPSSTDASPQSLIINVSTEPEKSDVIIPPSLRRIDNHLQPSHEELVEKGPPITQVLPLKPLLAAASATSSSSSFGTVQPFGLGPEASEPSTNANQDHTWIEVRAAESSPSPSPSPVSHPEHPRMSAEHSHHARTIVSQSLSVDGHSPNPSRSPSASPAMSRSQSPSNSRSPSHSPAPSPPPKSFRHSITNGLKRMSLPRSPSAKSSSRGSYERERSSYEDEPLGHSLSNIPQAQLVNFQSPVPLRDIQLYQDVLRPNVRPLQLAKRTRKIDPNPAAMFCSEVTTKRSAGERCMLYAQKINELWAYDCGLAEWMEDLRDRGSGSAGRGAAISLIQSPPTSPTSPSMIPFTSQPRQTSQSSHASVITEATFPRRPDAFTATDLSITMKEATTLAPSSGPPPLPYPSLATASQKYQSRSNFASGSSSGSESTAKGYRSLMAPLTPSSKTGAFFASLGRKASVSKKDKGLGSASGSNPARLTKPQRILQNSQLSSSTTASASVTSPSVPGGPRAPPNRMLKSQTIMISPMRMAPDNANSPSAALGKRPSLYDIPSGDSIYHSSASHHGHTSVRGGPRAQSSSPSKAPSMAASAYTSPYPESSWDPEFKRQVDGLSDLMPQADRTILAGYLRRAGQDILAIGQYLEDEKNGRLRRD
ncbi:hypothetical protein D9757_000259 [Collybiopsis confluens]|uniref:type I protein arginine methyltransferase n=1 Tax=Collybiopsis confluens TaxID=2823264 RepID=A0A8H5I254_9AGAR|nr:hypothetical protein D9757_000259 [Collybiopsis confluens]